MDRLDSSELGWLHPRYRIDGELGRGGMGKIYRATDETLQREVALKVIHPRHRLNPRARARFVREAHLLSQLRHRNICGIYDYIEGEDHDVLVLELIEGETLRHYLREDASGLDELSIIRQIGDALLAAHAEGIVHRDLKPENVMITKTGHVKVLDFGLARPFDSVVAVAPDDTAREPMASGAFDDAAAPDPGGSLQSLFDDFVSSAADVTVQQSFTGAGRLIGTLRYMSPEQAGGEAVTSASDMFSFGLVIQELVTKKPAYDVELEGDELHLRVFEGRPSECSGVRSDLHDLIKRLLLKAAARRPTAVEAAKTIARIQGRQARRLRYGVAAAVIVAAFLGIFRYTVDVTEAEGEARQRRAQAEALIRFMLDDLRGKLAPLGRLDVLDDIGDQSLEYLTSIDTNTLTPEEALSHGKALRLVGEVRADQGDLPAALEAYRESLRLAEALSGRDPRRVAFRREVGEAHSLLGQVYRRQNALDDAKRSYDASLAIARALIEKEPDDDELRRDLSNAYYNIGRLHEEKGELAQAFDAYRETLAIDTERSRDAPSDRKTKEDLASTYNTVGLMQEKLGRLDVAESYYRSDLELKQELSDESPEDTRWTHELGVSHTYVASLLVRLGRLEEALPHFEASFATAEGLAERDPSNSNWQRELAVAARLLGSALLHMGESARAGRLVAQSVEIHEWLAKRDPSNHDWREELAASRLASAEWLLSRGEPEQSLGQAEAAAALMEPHRRSENIAAREHRLVAEARLVAGQALDALGQRRKARASWTSGADLMERALDSVEDTRFMAVHAKLLLHLDDAKARVIVQELDARGYREKSFLGLCARRGVPVS